MNIWGYVAIGVFILTVLAGSFLYFRWSQDQIAQLNQVVAAQQAQVALQSQAISSLETRIKIVEELRAKLDSRISQNHINAANANKKLNNHNLEVLSQEKPQILENAANIETKRMFDDLSKLSSGGK